MTSDAAPLSMTLPADPAGLDAVHDLVGRFWAEQAPGSDQDRLAVELALVEIAANAVRHGQGATFTVSLRIESGSVVGELFEPGDRLPDDLVVDRCLPDDDAESGRGIPLARAAVDDLQYRHVDGVNCWTVARAVSG